MSWRQSYVPHSFEVNLSSPSSLSSSYPRQTIICAPAVLILVKFSGPRLFPGSAYKESCNPNQDKVFQFSSVRVLFQWRCLRSRWTSASDWSAWQRCRRPASWHWQPSIYDRRSGRSAARWPSWTSSRDASKTSRRESRETAHSLRSRWKSWPNSLAGSPAVAVVVVCVLFVDFPVNDDKVVLETRFMFETSPAQYRFSTINNEIIRTMCKNNKRVTKVLLSV